jgi:hypothetical protein
MVETDSFAQAACVVGSPTMGLLDRLLGRAKTRPAAAVSVHAGDLVEVVGESYRQEALRRVAAIATDGVPFLNDLSGRPR